MPWAQALLLLSFLCSAFMTGVIWFVQVVHYPLFGSVGSSEFPAYESEHARLTTWVVMPPMLVELGTALLILRFRPPEYPLWAAATSIALVAVIWASTFLLQVPQHNALAQGYDPRAHGLLVGTNWVRTVAWTLRTLLLGWFILAMTTTRHV